MTAVKARIRLRDRDSESVVPIFVPDLEQVKRFALDVHVVGRPWKGEAFGWEAEYNPERTEPPPDSKMTFTPADFCIGESGIWFFSMMWENGRNQSPFEYLDDRSVVGIVE